VLRAVIRARVARMTERTGVIRMAKCMSSAELVSMLHTSNTVVALVQGSCAHQNADPRFA